MKNVIGLVGPAGAGKSSVAAYLEEAYGARRYAFARPLKEMCMAAFDLTHEQCWGTQAEKEAIDPRYGVSARQILQRVGTDGLGDDLYDQMCSRVSEQYGIPGYGVDIAREGARSAGVELTDEQIDDAYVRGFRTAFGANIWIHMCLGRIDYEATELAVIEDVRFTNEAGAIREPRMPLNVYRGHVWRLWPVGETTSTDSGAHASETEWRTIPARIVSQEIKPRERGIPLLHALARAAAESCGIRPVVSL